MQLLYTLTAYPPSVGGGQLHAHMLLQSLKDRHNIQVISQWDNNRNDWLLGSTVRAPDQDRDYDLDGISVHRFGLSLGERLGLLPYALTYYPLMSRVLPGIAACLERHFYPYALHADLIHNIRIGREGLSYASLYAARRQDIPLVFTPFHHPRWVGWRYKAFIDLYGMADAIIALTNAEKQTLIRLGVCEDRIFVSGIGPVLGATADPERFIHEHLIDGPVVLFLGQHYAYKGYRQLLEAARLVWDRVPEAHFVFIGPPVGNSERDFEIFRDRRILRLGKVDLQRKTDALAACTLLCVPSSQESFGGVYTEAWSFGKPVIGCPIPAVSEVIADGVDGYLVKQDPKQITECICDLLLNPARTQTMGEAGKRKVNERYNWQRIADLTEQAYHNVLRQSSSQA